MLAPFATLAEVAHAVPHLVGSGVNPTILEYIDVLAMAGITRSADLDLGVPDAHQGRHVGLPRGRAGRDAGRPVEEDVERLATLLSELGAL